MLKQSILLSSSLLVGFIAPAHAAGTITLTHKGKPVNAIPVDQLGDLQIMVKSPSPFKSFYKGQWGSLNHAFKVHVNFFKNNSNAPSLSDSTNWEAKSIAESFQDSTWPNKTALNASMFDVAKNVSAYNYDNNHTMILTGHYSKQYYTGKKIWQKGGWVKETKWSNMDPAMGQATLKLLPPTFASTLKLDTLKNEVIQKANGKANSNVPKSAMDKLKGSLNDGKAEIQNYSRDLLYPTSYGGTEVDFSGSQLMSIEQMGAPTFSWNYHNSDQFVDAKIPVKFKMHAVVVKSGSNHPVPLKTEADFVCTSGFVAVRRNVKTSKWVVEGLSRGANWTSSCKTPDGKTPEQVAKSATPTADNLLKGDPVDKAKDLLNGLGF